MKLLRLNRSMRDLYEGLYRSWARPEFNSLDAQYEAASAISRVRTHAGWILIRSRYDDGGYSGGSTDRPDLQKIAGRYPLPQDRVSVVYKAIV